MKDIFSKDNLPLIDRVIHGKCTPRENWVLMCDLLRKKGHTQKSTMGAMLLRRGAAQGDPWSMCQLARKCYFLAETIKNNNIADCLAGATYFTEAISWWTRAARLCDEGAISDLKSYDIYKGIVSYKTNDGEYADAEVKCAMLTEYILTDLGSTPWHTLSYVDKIKRMQRLNRESCRVLGIDAPELAFVPNLEYKDRVVDGLAHWEGKIDIRYELLDDYERIIQVIFHELGHIIVFNMWNVSSERARRLRKMYGIDDAHAELWYGEKPKGGELPQTEKDPDTLSYGVYTAWGIMFAELQ